MDITPYIETLQKEPSVVPVIPAIVDFIYNKCIDFVTHKPQGDADMLLTCIKVINAVKNNEYYNCEEKIHLFIDLLYDSLIRDEYNEDSLKESQDIIIQTKNISAETLNMIILEYGTKYQSLSNSIFDSICALLQADDQNNMRDTSSETENSKPKPSYLLFYGPLKLISLQNIFHFNDSSFYLKLINDILSKQLGLEFKEPCMDIIKKIILNIYQYFELNKYTLRENTQAVEELLTTANKVFPHLIHKKDKSLEIF